MKIERTKNASRNMIFGIALNIYQIIIPFIMRTAMIYFMGVQYTGLNSLFTSVLKVLNLAELGVGSAMTYSMYKPIAEDDSARICALMRLYRLYYRVIGLVIAVAGIALTPFIPKLIKGEVPGDANIYILYWLNLFATVLTYWLFAYKNCLLVAHQRNDITSKVAMITNFIQYVFQFFVIYFFHNYYAFVAILLVVQAITNISTAVVADKLFPQYKPKGKLNKEEVNEINTRIRDLFTAKLGSVIVNSVDTIVISTFIGLKMLTIYQNYFFILSSIIGFFSVIFSSCRAGIGNSLVTETKEKNYNDLKNFTFIISWLAGFCTCCLLVLYQPFMEVWVGEELKLEYSAVVCFCIYFFVRVIQLLLCLFKDAGGIWREDRLRPLTTALSNLFMNLIMVQYWGIYGVILSTVISTIFVGMPWLVHNLFTTLFDKKDMFDYIKNLLFYVFTILCVCVLNNIVCDLIPFKRWGAIIIRGIICLIIPNILFFICWHNKKEFQQSIYLVDRITKGRLNLVKKLIK